MTSYSKSKGYSGYIGETPTKEIHKFMVIDDKVYQIHNVRVHEFMMGDVDDPDLYAAVPIIDWQKTEKGAWVMEHAVEEPMWHKHIEAVTYGWKFIITAKLKGPDYTFYMLKWGHNS